MPRASEPLWLCRILMQTQNPLPSGNPAHLQKLLRRASFFLKIFLASHNQSGRTRQSRARVSSTNFSARTDSALLIHSNSLAA
jgi:hypothetical protein